MISSHRRAARPAEPCGVAAGVENGPGIVDENGLGIENGRGLFREILATRAGGGAGGVATTSNAIRRGGASAHASSPTTHARYSSESDEPAPIEGFASSRNENRARFAAEPIRTATGPTILAPAGPIEVLPSRSSSRSNDVVPPRGTATISSVHSLFVPEAPPGDDAGPGASTAVATPGNASARAATDPMATKPGGMPGGGAEGADLRGAGATVHPARSSAVSEATERARRVRSRRRSLSSRDWSSATSDASNASNASSSFS